MARKRRRMSREQDTVENGDMAVIPDGAGVIVGVYEDATHALVGDVMHYVPPWSGWVVPKQYLLPEAGKVIGRRFNSLDEFRDATRPMLTPQYHSEHAAKAAPAAGGAAVPR